MGYQDYDAVELTPEANLIEWCASCWAFPIGDLGRLSTVHDRHDPVPSARMRNVFWLRPGVIGGRTGPNYDTRDPKALAAGGIGAVPSVNDGDLVRPDELAAVRIDYCRVPLSDAAPPQPGDLEICVSELPRALSFVVSSIDRRRGVLVHCGWGKDRTGLFLTYYLCVTEGLTPSDAIQDLRRVRPVALSAEGWESTLYQVLGELGFAD